MLGLRGKNAIITGASRGIGEAVVRSLVDLGVGVVGVGRTFPFQWNEQFSQPEKAVKVVGDVSDPKTAESALKMCLDKFGSIEILINNAGIVINTGILDLNLEDWDKQMDTNVKSFVYFCRVVAPEMVKQKRGGRIVNISSVAANFFESGLLAYSTTKGAIISLTRGLSIDLAPHNITVNAVAPGWVDTQMGFGSLPKEKHGAVLERIPLRHAASTDEIAGTVVFLCSDLSRYMTGQTITVDGGQTTDGTIKGVQY
jgi:3-oxoacyl-[acyl-carrier protein] reductase